MSQKRLSLISLAKSFFYERVQVSNLYSDVKYVAAVVVLAMADAEIDSVPAVQPFLFSKVTEVKLSQPSKAKAPILVTLAGIVILVRLSQFLNAYSPILVTFAPIIIDVMLSQASKAYSSIIDISWHKSCYGFI